MYIYIKFLEPASVTLLGKKVSEDVLSSGPEMRSFWRIRVGPESNRVLLRGTQMEEVEAM